MPKIVCYNSKYTLLLVNLIKILCNNDCGDVSRCVEMRLKLSTPASKEKENN